LISLIENKRFDVLSTVIGGLRSDSSLLVFVMRHIYEKYNYRGSERNDSNGVQFYSKVKDKLSSNYKFSRFKIGRSGGVNFEKIKNDCDAGGFMGNVENEMILANFDEITSGTDVENIRKNTAII
jgi:hypothetical protein